MKPQSTQKILIVDDVPTNIDLLREALKDEYRLFIATRGKQGLKLAQEKQPDLILLDIMMPEMDGYEVCKRLKENEFTQDIPIFFMTALDTDEDEAKGLEMGAVDYITKPLNMPIVQERVKTQLELKQYRDYLENVVKKRTEELSHTRKEIIDRLCLASEYRDPETGQHIKRMSYYCETLAQSYGLDEHRCELILHAAPMHDIGKIGISDNILLKKGRLTKEEFDIMKTHTSIGKNILSGKDSTGKTVLPEANWELIQVAKTIAMTHHEKWNGTGYPAGLKEYEIPIEGRIASLADVFDALTSERPYKKAWPVEEAFEEIKNQKNIHFEPDLVDLFFENESKILKIKSRFSDIF